MKSTLSLFAVLLICISTQAQKHTIALNLVKGLIYTQSSAVNIMISQKIGDQDVKVNMAILGDVYFKVTDETDSIYNMDVSYKSLSMQMRLPNGTAEFSSEKNDGKDIVSSILSKLKDRPFQIKLTKTGKVKEVKNLEALFGGVFDSVPGITEIQKKQIQSQLMQAYGEKTFKGNLEMLFSIFPDHPVSIGETWNVKTKLESATFADIDAVYKLDESTDKQYVITGTSAINMEGQGSDIKNIGTAGALNLKGQMDTKLTIDKKTGWITEGSVKQNLKGNIVQKVDKTSEDREIPMEITSEVIIIGN